VESAGVPGLRGCAVESLRSGVLVGRLRSADVTGRDGGELLRAGLFILRQRNWAYLIHRGVSG